MISRGTWLKCVCIFSFICGVVVPLFLVANVYSDPDTENSPFMTTGRDTEKLSSHERKPLDYAAEEKEDLHYQVQEMHQIVVSVRNELRQLEQERAEVRDAVDASKQTLSVVRKEVDKAKYSLQDSKERLAKVLRETKRANQYNDNAPVANSAVVVVKLPAEARSHGGVDAVRDNSLLREGSVSTECFDELCFDFTRCPLTSNFSVYVYNQQHPNIFNLKHPEVVDQLVSSLSLKHSLVSDPNLACVYVAIIGPPSEEWNGDALQHRLEALSHWNDGTNHVLVDLAYYNEFPDVGMSKHNSLGKSIQARSYLERRDDYNILIPPVTRYGSSEPLWQTLPPLIPALRQVLIYFEGIEEVPGNNPISGNQLTAFKQAITANTMDKVAISANCDGADTIGVKETESRHPISPFAEWALCGTAHTRSLSLTQATFALIISGRGGRAGPITFTRLVESLRHGAVPVILGISRLPYDSVIEWKRLAIVLPTSSLGELHYILRNIDTDTILKYRRQGRFVWESYLSSPLAVVDTVVAIVRQRALHPPPPADDATATNLVRLLGSNFVMNSPEFVYNFTFYTSNLWNSPPGPFYMYPTTPFKPVPVSGSQYIGLTQNQFSNLPHHVVDAGGITGPFFEDYLLGNVPDEQFTVVILTYDRNQVLLDALGRLKDLDHLAKVVVVWNNQVRPSSDLKWPDIGVPIDVSLGTCVSMAVTCSDILQVVSTGKNSLNNRFLPYPNIQTEAVLSLDDDVHLRQDEIQFAFRLVGVVPSPHPSPPSPTLTSLPSSLPPLPLPHLPRVWREARDRVVGFPGRFHAWDTRFPGWLYNSNYTCELSMVLTGAAFVHKVRAA